ncbi:transposase [Streptomyces sp. NPDC048213]|uniref:IS110 family transposase n=1 Tax=Streptomyces sp. NPDC048213 TaxID=3160984 RepID=UPI0033D74CCA
MYYLLEATEGIEPWLLNAQHMRTVPERKTDVSDAQWICRLVENGLVRPSFVPPVEIRRLRDLTRLNTDFQESIEVVLDGLESWSARRCCTEAVAFTSTTVTSVVCTSVISLGAGPLSLTASDEARRVSVRRTS